MGRPLDDRRCASDRQVHGAAEGANIAKDIEAFPEGFKTLVGERGITLSGGQKQRTAIARALVRDPTILILDDALSAVDTATEEKILRALREIRSDSFRPVFPFLLQKPA